MGGLFKWLLVVAAAGLLLLGGSYLGARATVGKLLGPNPPEMGNRSVELPKRATNLRGAPIVWKFSYEPTKLASTRTVRVYVSLKGDIIATEPGDLRARLERYYESRLP